MPIKKYLFRPKKKLEEITNKFIHYGTNEGENFPDVKDIEEDYLDVNYNDYKGEEVESMRLETNTLEGIKIELGPKELYDNKTIFVKLEDTTGREIPRYYYADAINQISDENYSTQSFSIICKLDYGATFGCKMNYGLKQDDCKEKFLFLRKMCNRFYRNPEGKDCYYIDYLLQPGLMQTGKYQYSLIRDIEEEDITLKDGLFINSNAINQPSWYLQFIKGIDNNLCSSYIDCAEQFQPLDESIKLINGYFSEENKGKLQNLSFAKPKAKILNYGETDDILLDEQFNSNGKYRYFALKLGNNSLPTKDDNKATAGLITTAVQTKTLESEQERSNINGETICLIPFAKGKLENEGLYQLNNTNSGLIVGNGTVLGMPVNDIPPSILASAIRTYNDKNKVSQTLGDKLSFRAIEKDNKEYQCFGSISSLRLLPFYDGVDDDFIFDDLKYQSGIGKGTVYDHEPEDYDKAAIRFTQIKPFKSYSFYGPDAVGQRMHGLAMYPTEDPSSGIGSGKLGSVTQISNGPSSFNMNQTFYLRYKGTTSNETDVKNINNGEYITKTDSLKAITYPTPTVEEYKTLKEGDGCYYKNKYDKNEKLYHYTLKENFDYIPCIFNDFSKVPVSISKKIEGQTYGNSRFFKKYDDLINLTSNENIQDNEPLIYGPAFWQGIYYIDGLHKVILTADMIDFDKFAEDNGNVYLDVGINTNTFLRLNIGDIRNDLYPFTKSMTELISSDPTLFPSTCETFNSGLLNNTGTQETSKNAKDIDIKWARTNGKGSIPGTLLGNIGEGTAAGSQFGGQGALIGAAIGTVKGGAEIGFSKIGLENSIKQLNEKGENEGQGSLGNMYNAPTSLNASGYASGSLTYSPADESKNQYNTFKTFTITEQAKREIGNDISMNGYYFKSQCLYKDYVNRNEFNIVNCNFDDKTFYVDTYLRNKMIPDTMIFSQLPYIEGFKAKCKGRIRLFKNDFKPETFNDIIKKNTEISYVIPDVMLIDMRKKEK